MMPLQRACDAESQVRNKLSNGPLRVQSNGVISKYSATCGIRQLPGICWYPAKCTGHAVNQGGTADKCFYSSLIESISLSKAFLFYKTPLSEIEVQRSLFFVSGGYDMLYTKRWWRTVRRILKLNH